MDFDPIAISELTNKKITSSEIATTTLLSEQKLRSILENANQVCKVIYHLCKPDHSFCVP